MTLTVCLDFVFCIRMSSMANGIPKNESTSCQIWPNSGDQFVYFIWMSAYTNVLFDECLLLRMSAFTNVRFDECPLWRMSALMNVLFDECPPHRILGLFLTISTNTTQHNILDCYHAECPYVECRIFILMLSTIMQWIMGSFRQVKAYLHVCFQGSIMQ
jgi:hypothetical protein